jgi:hypothetical protein
MHFSWEPKPGEDGGVYAAFITGVNVPSGFQMPGSSHQPQNARRK